jgi:hypothetical protein
MSEHAIFPTKSLSKAWLNVRSCDGTFFVDLSIKCGVGGVVISKH